MPGQTVGRADTTAVCAGLYFDFEVKTGSGRPDPKQLLEQRRVRAAGGIYEFVGSAAQVVRIVQERLNR